MLVIYFPSLSWLDVTCPSTKRFAPGTIVLIHQGSFPFLSLNPINVTNNEPYQLSFASPFWKVLCFLLVLKLTLPFIQIRLLKVEVLSSGFASTLTTSLILIFILCSQFFPNGILANELDC